MFWGSRLIVIKGSNLNLNLTFRSEPEIRFFSCMFTSQWNSSQGLHCLLWLPLLLAGRPHGPGVSTLIHSEQTWPCPLLFPSFSFSFSPLSYKQWILHSCVHSLLMDTLLTSSRGTGWKSVEAKHRTSDYPREADYFRYLLAISLL